MTRRAPYSPAEVGADEYLARSALPPPPDIGQPWDAEPSPTAARWTFALLVCGAVVAGLVVAFVFIARS